MVVSCLTLNLAAQVAESLVGCSLPLTKLAQELHQLYLNCSQDTAVTETAIRNCIIELAARKCQDSAQGVHVARLTCNGQASQSGSQ